MQGNATSIVLNGSKVGIDEIDIGTALFQLIIRRATVLSCAHGHISAGNQGRDRESGGDHRQ